MKKKPEKSFEQLVEELHDYEELDKHGYFDDLKKIQDMNILTVHFKEKPSNHLKFHIWLVPGFHFGLCRNLKARGIPQYPIAARLMTEEEVERYQECTRQLWLPYQSWPQLIDDERSIFPNNDWENILIELSNVYSCFKETIVGKHGQIKLLI